jgi:hypothetical protein
MEKAVSRLIQGRYELDREVVLMSYVRKGITVEEEVLYELASEIDAQRRREPSIGKGESIKLQTCSGLPQYLLII